AGRKSPGFRRPASRPFGYVPAHSMATSRGVRRLAIGLGLLLALVAVVVSRMRADLPAADLRAKWGSGASRFIDVDGLSVHYRDEGTGPAVVLVHGTSS